MEVDIKKTGNSGLAGAATPASIRRAKKFPRKRTWSEKDQVDRFKVIKQLLLNPPATGPLKNSEIAKHLEKKFKRSVSISSARVFKAEVVAGLTGKVTLLRGRPKNAITKPSRVKVGQRGQRSTKMTALGEEADATGVAATTGVATTVASTDPEDIFIGACIDLINGCSISASGLHAALAKCAGALKASDEPHPWAQLAAMVHGRSKFHRRIQLTNCDPRRDAVRRDAVTANQFELHTLGPLFLRQFNLLGPLGLRTVLVAREQYTGFLHAIVIEIHIPYPLSRKLKDLGMSAARGTPSVRFLNDCRARLLPPHRANDLPWSVALPETVIETFLRDTKRLIRIPIERVFVDGSVTGCAVGANGSGVMFSRLNIKQHQATPIACGCQLSGEQFRETLNRLLREFNQVNAEDELRVIVDEIIQCEKAAEKYGKRRLADLGEEERSDVTLGRQVRRMRDKQGVARQCGKPPGVKLVRLHGDEVDVADTQGVYAEDRSERRDRSDDEDVCR